MTWIERLFPEQRPAFEFVCSHAGTLLTSETGTGKTYVTLGALERLNPQLTLLVVPLTSLDVIWYPKLATLEGVQVVRTWKELRATRLKRPVSSPGQLRTLLLLHFQAFASLSRRLARLPWEMVVIDEAQGLKARNSGWSRAARRFRHVPRRLALTATPLDESPIDIWAQLRFVDHTIFGEDFIPFAERYCRRGGYKNKKWVFRRDKLPQFLQACQSSVFRLTKQFLNLPPLKIHLIPTQLLGRQRFLYEELNIHGIIDNPNVTAPLAVTKQVKLEQMTGGLVIDDIGHSVHIGSAKKRKLMSLIPDLQPPIVVFCKYLHEIPVIDAALRGRFKHVAELHGKIKDKGTEKVRTNLINSFQSGNIDALICQVRTGGVSIEFTRSSTLIFYSMNFSLIDFEQIIGRFHRGGQENEVDIFIIHCIDTVDMEIISAIERKQSTFYEVVTAFERK